MNDIGLNLRITTQGGDAAASAVDRIGDSSGRAARSLAEIERSSAAVTASLSRMGQAAATVFGGREVLRAADQWQNLNSQLAIATGSALRGAQAYGAVLAIARETGQALDQVGAVYRRIADNATALGISQTQVAASARTVAQAIALSGGSAASSEAALVQFGQALASGVLRGEELNSVMEQAPRLARALADGLGVPLGKLRELAEQGQITSEAIVKALAGQASRVADEFGQLAPTIGRALQNVRTAWVDTIGSFEQSTGVFRALAGGIQSVADHLPALAAAGTAVAVVFAGRAAGALATAATGTVALAAASRQAAQAQLAQAGTAVAAATAQAASAAAIGGTVVATEALVVANRQLAVAQELVAVTGAKARALSLLGGWVGVLTTVVLAGAAAWSLWRDKSEEATAGAARSAVQNLDSIIQKLAEMNSRLEQTSRVAYQGVTSAAASELKTVQAQIGQLNTELDKLDGAGGRGRFGDAGKQKQAELNALVTRETQLQEQLGEARRRSGEVGTAALQKFLDAHAVGADKIRVDQQKVLAEFAASIRETGGVFDGDNPAHSAALRGLNAKLADIRSKGNRPSASLGDRGFEAEQDSAKAWAKTLERLSALTDDLASRTANWSKSQREINSLVGSSDWQRLTVAQKEIALAWYEHARAAEEAGAAEAAIVAAQGEYRKAVEAIDKNADNLAERAEALRFEAETTGMLQSEVYALLAARKEEAAERNSFANDNEERVAALRREAEAYRALAATARGKEVVDLDRQRSANAIEATARATEESARRWQQFEDDLGRGLTDAIFDGGKSGLDMVASYAKSLVIRPLVQMAMQPISNAVGSALGFQTGGGGNLLSGGSSLYSALSGGSSAAYGSFAMSGIGQSLGLSNAASFVGPMLPGAAAEVGMTALGSGIGAALPWVGGALAVASILGGLGDDPDAMRTGVLRQGGSGGPYNYNSIFGKFSPWDNPRWFGDNSPGQVARDPFAMSIIEQDKRIAERFKLSSADISTISTALARAPRTPVEFGMEHTDWRASDADEKFQAQRYSIIAKALGKSIEELSSVMTQSTEQWNRSRAAILLPAMNQTLASLDQVTSARSSVLSAINGVQGRNSFADREAALRELLAASGELEAKLGYVAQIKDLLIDRYDAERSAIEANRQAAEAAAEAQREALRGVGDYARSLLASDLAPGTAAQRLSASQGLFDNLLVQARRGDVGAIGDLSGAAGDYLQQARGFYASSADYSAIFGSVQSSLAALGLSADSITARGDWEAQMQTLSGDTVDRLTDLALLTEDWSLELENLLVDQTKEFEALGVKLGDVAANTQDLDKRIAALLDIQLGSRLDKLSTAVANSAATTARALTSAVQVVVRQ